MGRQNVNKLSLEVTSLTKIQGLTKCLYVLPVKYLVEISQNFVAFSESMNFNSSHRLKRWGPKFTNPASLNSILEAIWPLNQYFKLQNQIILPFAWLHVLTNDVHSAYLLSSNLIFVFVLLLYEKILNSMLKSSLKVSKYVLVYFFLGKIGKFTCWLWVWSRMYVGVCVL